jgi:hypothetical protein
MNRLNSSSFYPSLGKKPTKEKVGAVREPPPHLDIL